MARVTNISCYRFAPMSDLKGLRVRLLDFCKPRSLKGTILLAPEGVNLFIAGGRAQVDELVELLRGLPGLEGLAPKYSESAEQPFSRMLVRLKREIIAFGVEEIDPSRHTAPRLEARELKRWLDEGRPVVLLDTRNDYEVKLGTFQGAVAAGIGHFREFPEAVARLPEEMKDAPVVTFCTGGIRCEKAAPLMERMGFNNVWQLEGGILKYFEEVGEDHYEGECFVFDQRVGVDPALRETGSAVCFACQTPLTAEETEDPRYVAGQSCSYCYRSSEEKKREAMARRQEALDALASRPPGSEPYENRKPIRVPGRHDGRLLLDLLDEIVPHFGRETWVEMIEAGRIEDQDGRKAGLETLVRVGESYVRLQPGLVEPSVNANVRLVDEQEAFFVIEKPAPLPMHPCGRFNRNTLSFILRQVWAPEVPRPAHRLDAHTTGLVVCARTRHIARLLQPQFERGTVDKTYLVKVWGAPEKDEFVVEAGISVEPTRSGGREIDDAAGVDALTRFRVLRRDEDGTSLLEARPMTGRTHQIRIHLWSVGLPVEGDTVYLRDGGRGDEPLVSFENPPLCLHAWKLAFAHPLSGERMAYESSVPAWAGRF